MTVLKFAMKALVPMVLATSAFAFPDGAYIEDVAHGGNGCPQGTVGTLLSTDKQKLSIFFDEYLADTADSRSGRVRKSCNIGVSVHVPQGFTVALLKLDYRGFVEVPKGGSANLTADYFFAGRRAGDSFRKKWGKRNRSVEQEINLSNSFYGGTLIRSRCGESVIIRANTSIRAKDSNHGDAYIQVDTIDASAAIVYQLQWKRCY